MHYCVSAKKTFCTCTNIHREEKTNHTHLFAYKFAINIIFSKSFNRLQTLNSYHFRFSLLLIWSVNVNARFNAEFKLNSTQIPLRKIMTLPYSYFSQIFCRGITYALLLEGQKASRRQRAIFGIQCKRRLKFRCSLYVESFFIMKISHNFSSETNTTIISEFIT